MAAGVWHRGIRRGLRGWGDEQLQGLPPGRKAGVSLGPTGDVAEDAD